MPEMCLSDVKLQGLVEQPLIVLAGNPNSGKTTAFNAYTGSRQHVGNYPGITVDKKEGSLHLDGERVRLIDLPGAYSLTAYSQEELVARSVLAEATPLAVLNIVEASALERNLFLTVQILEMGLPVALACNMMDEARKAGIRIDTGELSRRLGVPVVETVARTGEGLEEAMRRAIAFGRERGAAGHAPLSITYGADLDPALQRLEALIDEAGLLRGRYVPRWIALKLLEGDAQVRQEVRAAASLLDQADQAGSGGRAVVERLDAVCLDVARHIRQTVNVEPDAIIADYRYGFIRSILRGVLDQQDANARLVLSDKLDRVLTNALLGPILMLGALFAIFLITITVGAYPQGWVQDAFARLGDAAAALLPDGLARSLVVDGLIAGVGGVLGFVPLIVIMFLLIAFLEDSGYMARVAYILDRVFRLFGLHGSSVMPYVISGGIAGGCAVPGVLATRTLRSPKEKLATLLTLPFMACGAKLPVFLLLAGVFFPGSEAWVMFCLTLAGWAAALVVSLVLRSTIIRGDPTPFVLELPPYRLPTLRSLCIHSWERTYQYIKKAGTVIVLVTILIWAGMTFPGLDARQRAWFDQMQAEAANALIAAQSDEARAGLQEALARNAAERASEVLRNSYAGRLGLALEPLTRPAGFEWRTNIALLGGIAAKEAIVSTLGTAYSLGRSDAQGGSLARLIADDPAWSKASSLALMLFVLLYSPCLVALTVIRQEAGSWGWLAFSLIFNTALAYGVAVCACRIGRLAWG